MIRKQSPCQPYNSVIYNMLGAGAFPEVDKDNRQWLTVPTKIKIDNWSSTCTKWFTKGKKRVCLILYKGWWMQLDWDQWLYCLEHYDSV